MNAAIYLIGTELTTGVTQDVHAKYLASRFHEFGVDVRTISMYPDDTSFGEELERQAAVLDIIVITGGLGPTSDDCVREIVAGVAGVPLVFHQEQWEAIVGRFGGHRVAETNRKQAQIPEGFSAVPNRRGTACGFLGRIRESRVLAVPGPPRELVPMMEEHGWHLLGLRHESAEHHELTVTTFLISESVVEETLQEVASDRVKWGTRAEGIRIVVVLRGGAAEDREATFERLSERFGPLCVHRGTLTAAQVLLSAFRARHLSLSTAESCTGGLISAMLTEEPGSSDVVWGGFVTYSNESKNSLLGVTAVEKHGAVSAETVTQMAVGARERTGTSVSVAVSGIAGPGGGTHEKPVGTVWISACAEGFEPGAWKLSLGGGRDRVRRRSAVAALLLAYARGMRIDVDKDPVWDYI